MNDPEILAMLFGSALAVIAVVTLLVFATFRSGGSRYRPGLTWWAEPVWFGGPSGPVSDAAPSEGTGGSRARW